MLLPGPDALPSLQGAVPSRLAACHMRSLCGAENCGREVTLESQVPPRVNLFSNLLSEPHKASLGRLPPKPASEVAASCPKVPGHTWKHSSSRSTGLSSREPRNPARGDREAGPAAARGCLSMDTAELRVCPFWQISGQHRGSERLCCKVTQRYLS